MLTAQVSGGLQLGSTSDDVLLILKQVQPYVDVVKKVMADPALPAVVDRIRTISNLPSTSSSSSSSAPKTPAAPAAPGIGLSKVVAPLDAYIWSRKNPGKTYALGFAALLVPVAAGLLLGRATKRCKAPAAALAKK